MESRAGAASHRLPSPPADVRHRDVTVTRLSAVPPRSVSWLWRQRIPVGMVTILAGDGGHGKTTLLLDVAARVTRGREMPDGSEGLGEPAGVVMLSSEDDLGSVLVPRLTLAGAELNRVATVTVKTREGDDRQIVIRNDDLARMESALQELDARLVILDPLVAFAGEDTNLHRNQDARRTLGRLHALAERCGIAVVGVHHFNRGHHPDAVHRLTGSAGIANAARSVLVVARDPIDPAGERLVLGLAKHNLAPRSTPALVYRLVVPEGAEHPVVSWEGPCSVTVNELVSPPQQAQERSDSEDAAGFLRELLAGDREVLAKDGEAGARAHGITLRTLQRARRRAGVVAFRPVNPGPWYWRLSATPGESRDEPRGPGANPASRADVEGPPTHSKSTDDGGLPGGLLREMPLARGKGTSDGELGADRHTANVAQGPPTNGPLAEESPAHFAQPEDPARVQPGTHQPMVTDDSSPGGDTPCSDCGGRVLEWSGRRVCTGCHRAVDLILGQPGGDGFGADRAHIATNGVEPVEDANA